jgi:phage shock protein C
MGLRPDPVATPGEFVRRPILEGTLPMTEKKLRRSNGIFAGVCGGLGEFFGLNPWWFRLGFLIALIPGGVPGILLYLLCWLIIPGR